MLVQLHRGSPQNGERQPDGNDEHREGGPQDEQVVGVECRVDLAEEDGTTECVYEFDSYEGKIEDSLLAVYQADDGAQGQDTKINAAKIDTLLSKFSDSAIAELKSTPKSVYPGILGRRYSPW